MKVVELDNNQFICDKNQTGETYITAERYNNMAKIYATRTGEVSLREKEYIAIFRGLATECMYNLLCLGTAIGRDTGADDADFHWGLF